LNLPDMKELDLDISREKSRVGREEMAGALWWGATGAPDLASAAVARWRA
jgi:hypothetical protein